MASDIQPLKASFVPPPTAPDAVENWPFSVPQTARFLTRLVLGKGTLALDGQPSAAALEAVEMLRACTLRVATQDQDNSAEAVVALETMVPILGRLRSNGIVGPEETQRLGDQLETFARERLTGENPSASALAGAHQAAALLRARERIDPGHQSPALLNALAQAVQEHPPAFGPGLLSDILDPSQVGSLTLMRLSLLASGQLSRPAAPPRAIVEAAVGSLAAVVVTPGRGEVNPWQLELGKHSREETETFAAAVLQHPGLSANEAGRLLAVFTRTDLPRAAERMQTALEFTIDSLRARLGRADDTTVSPPNLAAAIVERGDAPRQLATLLALRSLNSAAGRGDSSADQIAWELLLAGVADPAHLSSPRAAAGATAACLTPDPSQGLESDQPPPLAERIARRLAAGLARVTAPMGEASHWAGEISLKWSRLAPGAARARAWSALTLAFELLADGRLPFSRPELLTRLLRNGANPGAVERLAGDHQLGLEDNLERVSAVPLVLSLVGGTSPALLNIHFVPGWRAGVSIEGLDNARRQRGWEPIQAAKWLEPDAVTVLADGELCGWIRPEPDGLTLSAHVKPVHALNDGTAGASETRTLAAVLSAVALSVAAEGNLALVGRDLEESIGALGRMSGNADLRSFSARRGAGTATADEVRELAISAGWRATAPVPFEAIDPEAVVPEVVSQDASQVVGGRGRGR